MPAVYASLVGNTTVTNVVCCFLHSFVLAGQDVQWVTSWFGVQLSSAMLGSAQAVTLPLVAGTPLAPPYACAWFSSWNQFVSINQQDNG